MNLSEEDIILCQNAFVEFDEESVGSIKVSDLKKALDKIQFYPNEFDYYKMISEIDENNTGQIKFSDFLNIFYKHKMANNEDDETDTRDAFVAMGGNEDCSGKVLKDKLIEIVKKEFELTIDIENLIKEVDEDDSGEIEWGEFKKLLKSNYANENV